MISMRRGGCCDQDGACDSRRSWTRSNDDMDYAIMRLLYDVKDLDDNEAMYGRVYGINVFYPSMTNDWLSIGQGSFTSDLFQRELFPQYI